MLVAYRSHVACMRASHFGVWGADGFLCIFIVGGGGGSCDVDYVFEGRSLRVGKWRVVGC